MSWRIKLAEAILPKEYKVIHYKELEPCILEEVKYEPPKGQFTPEDVKAEYVKLYNTAKIENLWNPIYRAVRKYEPRFKLVSNRTGVPWVVIAFLTLRECGVRAVGHDELEFKWEACIHNGDRWDKKTVNHPKGFGPWSSWEESAIHAMSMRSKPVVWTSANTLYFLEMYNGLGYRKYHNHVKSPYIWGGTTHYTRGGYASDGKWSETYVNKQVGAVQFLRAFNYL